jgi:hypothetical protein
MGERVCAKCLDCANEFELNLGPGFFFELLRCDQCGAEKGVNYPEIVELCEGYLKRNPAEQRPEMTQSQPPVEALANEEYYREIEEYAGKCSCGGQFMFQAPPRCPKCHSTNIEKGETLLVYD